MADMVQVRRKGGHSFREVAKAQVPRSQFNRSHGVKTTFDADKLIPILVDEVLPGDTFTLKTRGFARIFSPLKTPIMDNLYVETFYFFVPYRLVWANWEKFNGAQDDPGDSTDYTIPRIENGHTVSSFGAMDYFGLPLGLSTTNENVNALPFRAYNLIYNEWFRDQNLVDSRTVHTDDGPDTFVYGLQNRGKRHDYLTSCLPWPQKGTAPIASFPVSGIGKLSSSTVYATANPIVYETAQTGTTQYPTGAIIDGGGSSDKWFYVREDTGDYADRPAIYADVSINSLRQAFQIQKLLERDARGGTRYVEILKSHFRVTSPDFRLQRPEYLGGGTSFINISPVANTSDTATADQGKLAGVGTGSVRGGFAKSFVEHGVIIGLINARADLTYFQGLDRMWSRQTRYDFYWPSLSMIGEQAVLNKEIYVDGTSADDDVFGYQERYGEYRRAQSKLTGKFRPDATGALEEWHLAEEFGSRPSLNQTFIESTTPMSRVVAVTTEPDFIADIWFDYRCARPMPLFGTPGLMDHF